MKKSKMMTLLIVMILLLVWVVPASAQDLGDSDKSSFMVQNISASAVTVTVQFFNSTGTAFTPTCLDGSGPCTNPNPFSLAVGASKQITVGDIPSAQLPTGKYSVVISSTGQVAAVASIQSSGTKQFFGAYSSFNSGASSVSLPTVGYNYYGWYGMITVMNLGSIATDVTFTIKCTNVALTGTLTKTSLAANASHTWLLKSTVPSGFTGSTICQGGGTIISSNGQPLAVVNNQNMPANGRTSTFESVITGSSKVFLPQISAKYYQWISSINILKQGSGPTTVTVTWGDGYLPKGTCSLTDAAPACQLVVPNAHSHNARTSAVVTSSNGMSLLIAVGSSREDPGPSYSGGYNGLASGSNSVALPMVMRNYLGWMQAINCMNVSATTTDLTIAYEGKAPYDVGVSLGEGASVQIVTTSDTHLNDGYLGSAIITAKNASAQIACMVGSANPLQAETNNLPGDWATHYISLPK